MKHRCGTCGKLKVCQKADVQWPVWCDEWKSRTYKEILESCSSREKKELYAYEVLDPKDIGI